MRFIDLIHNLDGYVTIQAEGFFLERFLNICSHRELEIWNVRRCGGQRLTADMSRNSFIRLRPICSRTKTSVKIQRRHGLPFFLHRYRKRRFALIGLFLTIALLWYCSGHIMGITVFGNQRIPTDEVLTHLASAGVSLGKPAHNLDSSTIRNRLMRDLDDLAWVGININGSRVYVEVVERLEKEPGVAMDQPCNLVALKDGIIDSVEARNGQTMVKPGSGVCQGDVLVSGIMDNAARGYRYVHAYGQVIAKTRYTASGEYSLKYDEALATGAEKNRYTLRFLNAKIPLFLGKDAPYTEYSMEETQREYRLPVESVPSLFVTKQNYREQQVTHKTRTAEEALAFGENELCEELKTKIPEGASVVDQELSSTLTERETVEVTLTLICRENIATEMPLDVTEEMLQENGEAQAEKQ